MIEVASCTLKELFNSAEENIPNTDIKGKITIPEYQRPYMWTEKEVKKLLIDLEEYFSKQDEETPLYYLGSIIIHNDGEKLNIIDGQQRLTTFAIIQNIINNTSPKIVYDSPISIYNIQKNNSLIRYKHYERVRSFDLSKINVTLVITRSEDDAYTFFETQNTGGVRLTGVDIIKSHHLREITKIGGLQDTYAEIWEKQKSLEVIIELLIKARWWNVLNWKNAPSDRDLKGTKQSIISEFSESTNNYKDKTAYQMAVLSSNYSQIKLQKIPFSIRQPLSNGENFIDYLEAFSELYQRLFVKKEDKEISEKYYKFNKEIICVVDGTAFIKELYEIAILCYVNKFGVNHIFEASLWIFRYCYSIRISNHKTVREDSIPAFLRGKNYIFDQIICSYSHEELINILKSFTYEFSKENITGNTVKSRFIERISTYFLKHKSDESIAEFKNDFDKKLKQYIKKVIHD